MPLQSRYMDRQRTHWRLPAICMLIICCEHAHMVDSVQMRMT